MPNIIKKLYRTALLIFTSISLMLACLPYAEAYTNPVTTLRIGLCFESNGSAVSTLILTNSVGKGFNFGSFDASRNFVKNNVTTAANVTSVSLSVSNGVVVVTDTASKNVLFQSNNAVAFGIMPIASGTSKCVTGTNWGYSYYGGFEVTGLASGKLQVINVVNIEDYIKGVIPVEMSSSWPLEALKAQAMCARNFVANRMSYHNGFDVCDGNECQVYGGVGYSTPETDAAVDATAGKYVLFNGTPCQTFFYSSNGGASESSENVWVATLPYLTGKFDDYEQLVDTGRGSWTFTYSAAEMTDILNNSGYKIGTVTSVTPVYTAVGNIYSLTFSDGTNKITVSKQEAGNILCSSKYGKYTYSQRFTITGSSSTATGLFINNALNPLDSIFSAYAEGGEGSISKITIGSGKISVMTGNGLQTIDPYGNNRVQTGASFVVKGSGWGHNVGMSQYGAKAMAQIGKSYIDILTFYFTGVTIG